MAGGAHPVRLQARIFGAVQGVGFRPCVYRLAVELELAGHVENTAEGVTVEAEGSQGRLEELIGRIQASPPPLSFIERIETCWLPAVGLKGFRIQASGIGGTPAATVLPDIGTCPDCLRETNTPGERRYRYPFTNCTNCGPRFSIIVRLPYDRPNTSMAGFPMCNDCRREYENPADRRFHAQPIACPACGPHVELWDTRGHLLESHDAAIRGAATALAEGLIVAMKGMGGFHLMCDARNEDAVRRLRERKHREEKPFALLYPGLARVEEDCAVSERERLLLESPERPIVLLYRREHGVLAENVAPGAPRYGIMLPCTPLHDLLMSETGFPIVATSGNLSEEPLCTNEYEALERLNGIADTFLVHNRPIVRHVDDSIAQVVLGREMLLRRARGYAPLPVRIASSGPPLFATGAHLKNTVAVAKGGQVFLSQHIGDLETAKAFDAFLEAGNALQQLYEVQPVAVACDKHPDYVSTRHARQLGIPNIPVQHHYAHVLACMAEHGVEGPVLGVSWDGSGFGDDGLVWGGEFIRAERTRYQRVAHLRPFPLPGGDAAVREPRRSAFGLLYTIFGRELAGMEELAPVSAFDTGERRTLLQLIERGVNTPQTTSAGRLFDAVAALLGLHPRCRFEGQAAMALEYAARRAPENGLESCEFVLTPGDAGTSLDWEPFIRNMIRSMQAGVSPERLAAAFHHVLARAIRSVAALVALPDVVLTGGCFQNALLTELAVVALREAGFRAHWHCRVPPNDGGIALGQAVHAHHLLTTP